MIDSTIAHFRITGHLGEGGMGTVYRAEDSRLGREVAIKVLPRAFTEDPDRLARFEREARVLASVAHPNIAAIYEVGCASGPVDEAGDAADATDSGEIHYLVLELAEGETLADRIARGPLGVDEALPIAIQIAEALEAAHERGIVHRDLKPANVSVTRDGKVKVLDFGLAKALGSPAEGADDAGAMTQSPTLTARMTVAGVILGTAGYMSPEQAKGSEADRRSDIWALGVVLAEMLTGKRLFAEDTVAETLAAVLKTEPDLGRLPADLPWAVRRVIDRCLAKDPADRMRDVADVRLDLQEALEAPTGGAAEPARRRSVGLGWKVATVVSLLALGVVGSILWRTATEPSEVVRAFVPPPDGAAFLLDPTQPGPVAVSPDGRSLAFVAIDVDSRAMLWVRQLDELEARPLPRTAGAGYPFWSHDSSSLGYFADRKLRRIDVNGGPPVALADAPNGKGGSWSVDDMILFTPDAVSGLHRVSASGGPTEVVTVIDPEAGENSHRHPRFLADGRRFLYLARVGGGGPGHRIMLGSLDGGEPHHLLSSEVHAEPAGGLIWFVHDGTLMTVPFDEESGRLAGKPLAAVEDVGYLAAAAVGSFSVSRGNVLAYHVSGAASDLSHLVWQDRTGRRLGDVGVEDSHWGFSLSPDESAVASSVMDGQTGEGGIWLLETGRSVRTRFASTGTVAFDPVWSPDGSQIAFAAGRGRAVLPYVKPVATGGEARPLIDGVDLERLEIDRLVPRGWSPGGLLVAEAHTLAADMQIWTVPIEGGEPEPFILEEHPDTWTWQPSLSPDGRWLAWTTTVSMNDSRVFVTPFPAGDRRWQASSGQGTAPFWSPTGEELYYLGEQGRLVAVAVDGSDENFVVGESETLFRPDLRHLANIQAFANVMAADSTGRFLVNTQLRERSSPPVALVVNWREAFGRDD